MAMNSDLLTVSFMMRLKEVVYHGGTEARRFQAIETFGSVSTRRNLEHESPLIIANPLF